MVASSAGHPQELQRHARAAKAGGLAWTPACGSPSGNSRQFRYHVYANGGSSGFLDGAPSGILSVDDPAGVETSGNFALTLEARLSPAGPEGYGLVVLSYYRVETGVTQLLALQIDSGWTSACLLMLHCRTQRAPAGASLQRSSSAASASASPASASPASASPASAAGPRSSASSGSGSGSSSLSLTVVARLSSARLPAPPGRDPDDFHTLELHCRRGNTLSLWSDGRVVFASVDVRRALGLAQQRTSGLATTGLRAAAASPLTGPLGLGVGSGRLDFRSWRVAALAAGGGCGGCGGAGAARGMQAALAAAEVGDVERAGAWGDAGEWGADGRRYGEEEEEEEREAARGAGWGPEEGGGFAAGGTRRWDAGDADEGGGGCYGRSSSDRHDRNDRGGGGGGGGTRWARGAEGRGQSSYGGHVPHAHEEGEDEEEGHDWGPPLAARRAARALNAPPHTALAAAASALSSKWSRRPYIPDLDPQLVDAVMREVVPPPPRSGNGRRGGGVRLSDVLVRDDAKQLLSESVVMPLILPELFAGALEPWRGVLLFGPPGTGKTLLARAVAATAGITFFAVGAAALTSKWRGDSEKMVRTLFAVAESCAPAVVFVDEVDALVGGGGGAGAMDGGGAGGGDGDSEASRRFKSELLQQMDGLTSRTGAGRPGTRTTAAAGVLVLAASNSPWDIDPALRRRLEKRIYIGLPERAARRAMLDLYLPEQGCRLAADVDLDDLAGRLEGYSGADIKLLCRDALMGPLRRLTGGHTPAHYRRLRKSLGLEGGGRGGGAEAGERVTGPLLEVTRADVEGALRRIRPSVGREQVARYEEWDRLFAAV